MKNKENNPSFIKALKKATTGFLSMTPMLFGVVGLVGIVQTYITPSMMASVFGNGALLDTLIGTFAGAVSSGNPTISYLVGGELLEEGTSLYAITAFILSWVTLGIVQLPAEAGVLGFRFTAYRNVLSLISTVVIAIATVVTIGALK